MRFRFLKRRKNKYIYNIDLLKIDRLEVIDNNGRQLVKTGIKLSELSIQDNGKTLKIFIN